MAQFVSAIGQMSTPKIPAQYEGFTGAKMHSARWNASIELKGKRVAVIGSGASATQIIPELLESGVDVTVFPGTPEWVIPRINHKLPSMWPWICKYTPWAAFMVHAVFRTIHDQLFEATHYPRSRLANVMRDAALDLLERSIPDKERRDMLDPSRLYPMGVRRVHVSDRIYKALGQAKMIFQRVHRVQDRTLWYKDEYDTDHAVEFDVLIFATGFEPTQFLKGIEVSGIDKSTTLAEIWKKEGRPSAFKGMSISGFPNFFMTYGPNTNSSHQSVVTFCSLDSSNRVFDASQ